MVNQKASADCNVAESVRSDIAPRVRPIAPTNDTQEIFEFGRIGQPQDWLTVAFVAAVLAAVVWWIYRRELAGGRTAISGLLLACRLAAFGVLGWMFLDPRVRVETTVVHRPQIAILVDRSRSMDHRDPAASPSAGKTPSRWERVVAALAEPLGLERWRADREVSLATFGRAVQPLPAEKSLAEIPPDGDETRLGEALRSPFDERQRRPPAAVVVLSDGGQNAGVGVEAALDAAVRARTPVFVVPVGSTEAPTNIRIADVRLPARVFKGGDEAKGTAAITVVGSAPRTVSVEILKRPAGGKGPPQTLARQTVKIPEGGNTASVPLAFAPTDVGRWEIGVRVAPAPGEYRTDDNAAETIVDVVDRKTNVLVLAATPSREYQFLKSVLLRDKTVELAVVVQSAPPGVVQDAVKTLTQFPKERAELFAYDAVVALDPNWGDVEAASQATLADWVAQQAGGFVYLAGPTNGGRIPEASPIANLLPIVPRKLFLDESVRFAADVWPLAFTPEGASQPALRLDDDPAKSRALWQEFAGFHAALPVARVKPAATVWATVADPRLQSPGGEPTPVLAAQFFGSGRCYYSGTAELWRLRRLDERLYERLWVQLVRSAAEGRLLRGSGRGGFLLEEREYAPGSTIVLRGFFLDERFQPLLLESLAVSASTSAGPRELTLKPVAGQPGRYEGVLVAPPPGPVRLQAALGGGTVVEETLAVRESRLELDDLRANRELLTRVAQATGGRVVELDKLQALDDLLPKTPETTVLSGTPRPLWDRALTIWAFVGMLGVEWLVRKLRRLA